MKVPYKQFFFVIVSFFIIYTAKARDIYPEDTIRPFFLHHNYYTAGGLDAAIFSTATMQRPGYEERLGTLRFTLFVNLGATFHYDVNNRLGVFTGVDIKNVGFIEKRNGDSTVKHRVYNVGVPLGIKFGNMYHKQYLFAGTGLDMPFNYKEKGFVSRGDKRKMNEWFSTRTPTFMPYIFAGVSVGRGYSFKLQYYLNNFLSPGFVSVQNGVTSLPYAGYDVHLILLSVGHSFHYKDHNKSYHPEEVKIAGM